MVKYNYGEGPSFYTDSCLSGYGLWVGQDWQAGYFGCNSSPDTSTLCPDHGHWVNVHLDHESPSINILELVPVWLSLKRCGSNWRDSHVVCFTDNSSVKHMVNKGSSSNELCMVLLRDIFWLCAVNNIYLTARHISGSSNILADLLSRIVFTNDLTFIDQFSLCCSARVRESGYG